MCIKLLMVRMNLKTNNLFIGNQYRNQIIFEIFLLYSRNLSLCSFMWMFQMLQQWTAWKVVQCIVCGLFQSFLIHQPNLFEIYKQILWNTWQLRIRTTMLFKTFNSASYLGLFCNSNSHNSSLILNLNFFPSQNQFDCLLPTRAQF